MKHSPLFNETIQQAMDDFETDLEKIILQEIPLRDPSIYVVHITPKNAEQTYRQIILLFKRLKEKHSQWNYHLLNIEHTLFEILKEFRYIDEPNFALDCERQELSQDMKNSIKRELVEQIESKINEIDNSIATEKQKDKNPVPPFLLLMNNHAIYPYIQTKDIIARIINKKGILIVLLYLQEQSNATFEKETYKTANYNVHTIYLA